MNRILLIWGLLVTSVINAQQVNYALGDVFFNPSLSTQYRSNISFSVLDVQSKTPSSQRKMDVYTQYNLKKLDGLFGVLVSDETFASFNNTSVEFSYCHKVSFDSSTSLNLGFRSGMIFGELSNDFIFADQLSLFETKISGTQEQLITGGHSSFTTDVGISLKLNQNIMGASILNLVKPEWRFSTVEVLKPTLINLSYRNSIYLNQSNTLKLIPILLSSISVNGFKVGINSKVEFSGYEGFEGKFYVGVEYLNQQSELTSNLLSGYLGYQQEGIMFQYSFGNLLSYNQQLGSANQIILSYQF